MQKQNAKENKKVDFVNDTNESGGLIHSYQTPVLSFRLLACYWLNYRTQKVTER